MSPTVRPTADSPQVNSSLLPAWAVPAVAAGAWVELQRAVRALRWPPACERDPEAWWATRATPKLAALQDEAAAACTWCPVRELCASYAVAAGERHGVWGGTRPEDRKAAR